MRPAIESGVRGLKVVRFVGFGGGTEQLAQKVLSQKGPADFQGRYCRAKNGIKSFDYAMAGDFTSCCGVNLAVRHWGWLWFFAAAGTRPVVP
jgi:hypothetical protein